MFLIHSSADHPKNMGMNLKPENGCLIQKEDLVPAAADSMLFRMAPYIACVSSFCAFMVLPFSDGWVAVASDVGLFLIFGILSLEVVGIILAGYSSGSKWSLYGGMREAAQMVSYEIPLAICAVIPVIAAGSLSLGRRAKKMPAATRIAAKPPIASHGFRLRSHLVLGSSLVMYVA